MRISWKTLSSTSDSDRRCLSWLVVCIACLLAFCTEIVDSMILPPIHWNMSNPMFKTSNNDHVIQVNVYDELDFICPSSSEWEDSSQFEYYIIYQVSKKEYDDCFIYPETKAIMIVNCSSPNQRKRFTLLFEPFASIPNVPEFKPGGTFYYISTSTGQRDGITNVQQGACLYRNMKLTIFVCCQPTTLPPTVNDTDSTHVDRLTSESTLPATTTTTTTTTTVATTTTTRRPMRHTTPRSATTTTRHTKHTGIGTDKDLIHKTSQKPKDKDNKDNNVNKDNEVINDPKQEGLVNRAQRIPHSCLLSFCLCLLSSLLWR